ncbi:unnamed protein product [Lampetra fluviatilis]
MRITRGVRGGCDEWWQRRRRSQARLLCQTRRSDLLHESSGSLAKSSYAPPPFPSVMMNRGGAAGSTCAAAVAGNPAGDGLAVERAPPRNATLGFDSSPSYLQGRQRQLGTGDVSMPQAAGDHLDLLWLREGKRLATARFVGVFDSSTGGSLPFGREGSFVHHVSSSWPHAQLRDVIWGGRKDFSSELIGVSEGALGFKVKRPSWPLAVKAPKTVPLLPSYFQISQQLHGCRAGREQKHCSATRLTLGGAMPRISERAHKAESELHRRLDVRSHRAVSDGRSAERRCPIDLTGSGATSEALCCCSSLPRRRLCGPELPLSADGGSRRGFAESREDAGHRVNSVSWQVAKGVALKEL